MGLNEVASGERVHIVFFGMRNAGKSSVVNAVTGQSLSVVSPYKGTTTDPVKKAMELLPIGPVVMIDTPGIDDEGELGELRVKKATEALGIADVAVLVVDSTEGMKTEDFRLIDEFKRRNIPYIVTHNKADMIENVPSATKNEIFISAKTGYNIRELKEMIGALAPVNQKKIISDKLGRGVAVLVVPIDSAAPKGRLIMPQQLTIRDILDGNGVAVVCRETELKDTLRRITPDMVITDSQVFKEVAEIVDGSIMLTSFSILMARYKGDLPQLVKGAEYLDRLRDGDNVLIAEGCTHHRQCEDIGTVKLPRWIQEYTGKKLNFSFSSGTEFPDLEKFSLVVHCGACMLGEREMKDRIDKAILLDKPMTNYGVIIAKMKGILKRSLSPFKDEFKDL